MNKKLIKDILLSFIFFLFLKNNILSNKLIGGIMKLNEVVRKYEPVICDAIYEYIYENYYMNPILSMNNVEWFNNREFLTQELLDNRTDIYDILKQRNLWNEVSEKYSKYIVIPDVISSLQMPTSMESNLYDGVTYHKYDHVYDNVYDNGKISICIFNDKIFDLAKINMETFTFNYSGKTYIFFDPTSDVINIFGSGNSFKVITMKTNGGLLLDRNDEELNSHLSNDRYTIYLDVNNRVVEEVGLQEGENYSSITVDYKHIKIDLNDDGLTERFDVPGTISLNPKDSFIMNKEYDKDYHSYFFYHDEKLLFTNSAFVVYKDKSYEIIDMSSLYSTSTTVYNIDKHTIGVNKNTNIDYIIVWVRDYDSNFMYHLKPDSLYSLVYKENMNSIHAMKPYRKFTNKLYRYLNSIEEELTIDKWIEIGYKYDVDILKVIQNIFKTIYNVEEENIKVSKNLLDKSKVFLDRVLINIENKLNFYPLLFFKGKLITDDYKIIESIGFSQIVLDPRTFGFTTQTEGTSATDILNFMKNNIVNNNLIVALIPKQFYDINKKSYANNRVQYNTSINNKSILINSDALYNNELFVNGYLTNSSNIKNTLFTRFDSVQLFDFGDLDFTLPTSESPWSNNIPSFNNKSTLFYPNTDTTCCILNEDDVITGCLSIKFPTLLETVVNPNKIISINNTNILNNSNGFLIFDEFGKLINNDLYFCSSNYISYLYRKAYIQRNNYFIKNDGSNILHIIYLPLLDEVQNINLEIDVTKIEDTNTGGFNENCMNDIYIRSLFEAGSNNFNRIEVDVAKYIPSSVTVGNKILARYYMSCLERPFNVLNFENEVSPLNGKYVNTDASLGIVPAENSNFILNNNNIPCYNNQIVGSKVWYDLILSNSKYQYNNIYNVLDKNIRLNNSSDITVDISDAQDFYLNNHLNLFISNIINSK